jgi:peptidoglycan/LPS O-acetylase OafA/YrhL
MMKDVKETGRILSLDGMRAISILLVVFSHVIFTRNSPVPAEISYRWLDPLGLLGVRVFFVISGFLITQLLLKEMAKNQTINLAKFYFRRSLRIFLPFYFFIIALILMQIPGWVRLSTGDIFHALTYTVNYFPQRSWEVGHGWSLSVEEQFYLIWPAILLIFGSKKGLRLALLFFLLSPFIRLFYYYFFPSFVRWELSYRFETSADAIAIGCLLAGNLEWLKQQRLFRNFLNSKVFILVPFITILANELNPIQKKYLLAGISAENIGIALCIAWLIIHSSSRIVSILSSRPMVFVGQMSYSIYLWQQLFLNPRSSALVTSFPINLFMVVIVSLLAHFIVERPSFSLRKRLEKAIFNRYPQEMADINLIS